MSLPKLADHVAKRKVGRPRRVGGAGRRMTDYRIEGGCLDCACGRKYHVSLFRPILEVIAREAFMRGSFTDEGHVQAAIEAGYASGRATPTGEDDTK